MIDNQKIVDIVQWLDDKNCTLYQCFYNPQENGYDNRQAFLDDLQLRADLLAKSDVNQNAWREKGNINISRCLKGLKEHGCYKPCSPKSLAGSHNKDQ